jgi:hypothetical protein
MSVIVVKQSRAQVEHQKQLIRRLMDIENLKPQQIIDQLQIDERTFRRYRARIEQEDVKLHEKYNLNAVKYRETKFHQTLEDAYLLNKKLAEDPNVSPAARIEASKTMCTCQAQLAKLSREGLTFTPQLPNKVVEIEGKEVTV